MTPYRSFLQGPFWKTGNTSPQSGYSESVSWALLLFARVTTPASLNLTLAPRPRRIALQRDTGMTAIKLVDPRSHFCDPYPVI